MAKHETPTIVFRCPKDDASHYRIVTHRGDVGKAKDWILQKYPDAVFVYPK